eukprot:SAG22_NODE_1976_length_3219_cov_5.595192_2_plen_155_part_00
MLLELHQLLTGLTAAPILDPILPPLLALLGTIGPMERASQFRARCASFLSGLSVRPTVCLAPPLPPRPKGRDSNLGHQLAPPLACRLTGVRPDLAIVPIGERRQHCTVLLRQLTAAIYRITDTYKEHLLPHKPNDVPMGIEQRRVLRHFLLYHA